MSESIGKFNFWCENRIKVKSCEYCDKTGQLVIELTEGSGTLGFPKEEDCNSLLCPSGEEEVQLKMMGRKLGSASFSKMTKEQIVKDRKSRSTAHFKKEIFPTLGVDEQRHFIKKHDDLKATISLKTRDMREEGIIPDK